MGSSAMVARHAGAVAAVAVAATARLALAPYLGDRGVLPAFLLAVAASAWWCGAAPAVLALLLGAVAAGALFPAAAASLASPPALVDVGLYLAAGAILIALRYRLTGAQERAELERRRADAARAEAERAGLEKDRFLAAVAQELQAPLRAVTESIRVLHEGGTDADGAREALATADRTASDLARLVDDLRDLSGIAAGKMRLQVAETDLCALVAGVCASAQVQARAKGIDLLCDLAPEPARVAGDSARLSQAVAHLVGNALRCTPAGGEIRVRVFAPDGRAVVEVADTGEGIEPELLPHVWDRLRQADRERAAGGLGTGLAIARGIVELHGGSVQASSPGRGRGATLRLAIPCAGARAPKLTDVRPRF